MFLLSYLKRGRKKMDPDPKKVHCNPKEFLNEAEQVSQ